MGTTTTTTTTAGENALTCAGTVAVLPPALLWAASLAASTDTTRGVLCSIDVRRQADGQIRIAACDGHRLVRIALPQSEHFYLNSEQTEPIRLNPAAFSKWQARAFYVAIDASGVATFADRLNRPVGAQAWQCDCHANAAGVTYPNVDQLWPEETALTCNPGQVVAMNGDYLGDACRIAGKLSPNGVLRFLTTKSAHAPLIIRSEVEGCWLIRENEGAKFTRVYKGEPVWVEYLLMPVQIRK